MENSFQFKRWLRRKRRRTGFHLLRAVMWLSMVTGDLRVAGRCAELLGELHYRLDRRTRQDLQRQWQRLFPGSDPALLRARLRQAYRTGDRAVIEVLAMSCRPLSEDSIRAHCEISGLSRLQGALAEGRGVILLGMHMGNGILMSARLAAEGLPVSVVYRESRKMPDRFLHRCLTRHGVEGISARERSRAYREMLHALKQGRILFVLMDQDTKHGGVPVTFLGKRIELPAGPARLARRSRAPILPALPVTAHPNWQFAIGEPVDLGSGDIAEASSVLASAMETHVLAYPELWTWPHRRWRRYPFLDAAGGN